MLLNASTKKEVTLLVLLLVLRKDSEFIKVLLITVRLDVDLDLTLPASS